jgi:hypothetical protein
MSETLKLGGQTWTLPSQLPWRYVKSVQPLIFRAYRAAGGSSASLSTLGSLPEADLDALAEGVRLATLAAEDGPKLSPEQFAELPISVSDLVLAMPIVSRACGLIARVAGAGEATEEPGK